MNNFFFREAHMVRLSWSRNCRTDLWTNGTGIPDIHSQIAADIPGGIFRIRVTFLAARLVHIQKNRNHSRKFALAWGNHNTDDLIHRNSWILFSQMIQTAKISPGNFSSNSTWISSDFCWALSAFSKFLSMTGRAVAYESYDKILLAYGTSFAD